MLFVSGVTTMSSIMMRKEKYRVGKIFMSNTTPKDTINKLSQYALSGKGGYICVSNVRMVRYAGKNPEYAQLMRDSLMCLPDGTPLMWCGKLWGLNVACTNGPATFKAMLSLGDNGLKHYLLGDTQDVLDQIRAQNDKEYHAQIVGAEALPFTTIENFDYEHISARIRESGANIIWTAMRAPKQDEFDRILSTYLPEVPSVGVGRAFRLLIGEVQQAPVWAQKMGIAGIFTRKTSLWKAISWYFESFFFLAGYCSQIMWWKLTGRACDE